MQFGDDVEWSVEARAWTPMRTLAESALAFACASLFLLPLAHFVIAALVFASAKKEMAAHVIIGLVVVLAALVEVSLLRGLIERVLARWAQRWRFRPVSSTSSGAGWVQMAAGRALAGYGSIEENTRKYRWMADYTRGKRTAMHTG